MQNERPDPVALLLSFELSQDGDELDIHCDEHGLSKLKYILSQLENGEQHVHLMTANWGGSELTQESQSEDSQLLYKVTIHKW